MIYRHMNVWFDPVSLRISVDEPLQDTDESPKLPPEVSTTAVQAVVTRKCNLRCDYCNVRLSGDPGGTMTMDIAEKVIRLAEDAPAGRLLMVTGGEPLLTPEITFRILSETASPKVLFTNATLVTREIAERLRELDVSPVVSLDGMRENHDSQRSGSWTAAAAGLDLLRESGVSCGISTVVSRYNLETVGHDFPIMYNRFKPAGMGFNILHWTRCCFDPPSGEEYADVMEDVFRTALNNGIFVDQIARRLDPVIKGRYRYRDCSAMGGKVVVHPDGSLSNCISGREMEDWSRRIPFWMEYCKNCHAAGICGGGCAWDAMHLGGGDLPDQRHCLWVKRILDLFLEDAGKYYGSGPVSTVELMERYSMMLTRGTSSLTTSLGHGG